MPLKKVLGHIGITKSIGTFNARPSSGVIL